MTSFYAFALIRRYWREALYGVIGVSGGLMVYLIAAFAMLVFGPGPSIY